MLDKIIILPGTNACKAIFQERQDEAVQNYRRLLGKIEAFYQGHEVPKVIMVSPPPYGADDQLDEKYRGAGKRVKQLNSAFQELAEQEGYTFVDIQMPLDAVFKYVSPDCVHLS